MSHLLSNPRALRRTLSLLTLAVATAFLGCGEQSTVTDTTGPTPPSSNGSEVVPADVVFLDEGIDAVREAEGPGLMVDQADLDAFAGRFLDGSSALSGLADDEDDDERVFVGGVISSGCFAPDGVELRRDRRDLRLVPTGLDDQDPDVTCVRAITTVAVVSVARSEVPDAVTIDGGPASASVGPGEVQAIERLGGDVEPAVVEIDDDDALERLVSGLEGAPSVEALDLPPVAEESRRFGFVVKGCQAAGAEVVVADGEVSAVLRQADHEQGDEVLCEALEPYLVVADLPADLVP